MGNSDEERAHALRAAARAREDARRAEEANRLPLADLCDALFREDGCAGMNAVTTIRAAVSLGVDSAPDATDLARFEVFRPVLLMLRCGRLHAKGRRAWMADHEDIPAEFWGPIPEDVPSRYIGFMTNTAAIDDTEYTDIVIDRRQAAAIWPAPPTGPEAPPKPDLDGQVKASMPAAGIDQEALEAWYRQRIEDAEANGIPPSRADDERAAREQFGQGGRKIVRDLRNRLAPKDWKKGGRPSGPREPKSKK